MESRSKMETVKLVGGLVLLSLVIIFTLQNTATIGVEFLFWKVDASGAIFVFLNFAVGVVVGWILRSRQRAGGIRLRGDQPELDN
ncbi:MAG: LapA family protein [Chloroflexi bacterium]|nr:LapA family protein [Chloroflexota bacterium]MDA1146106.1 LapA family protein [Chloroflexota bacterium]